MDVEKTIQFILEHQAQHAVEIQQLREQLSGLSSEVKVLTASILKVVEVQNRQMDMIVRQQDEIVRQQDMIGRQQVMIGKLSEDQQQTRENLNALIKVVDQLVRRDGGRS